MSDLAYYCECQGNGHQTGCGLHLRLIIKYGWPEMGIEGICKKFNILNTVTAEANNEIDRLVNKYIKIWTDRDEKTVIEKLKYEC